MSVNKLKQAAAEVQAEVIANPVKQPGMVRNVTRTEYEQWGEKPTIMDDGDEIARLKLINRELIDVIQQFPFEFCGSNSYVRTWWYESALPAIKKSEAGK